jgi:hypothetical protein
MRGFLLPFIANKKIYPHQPGAAKYLARYGDSLVSVRYRYDAERKKRQITVELVVDERHWEKDVKRIPANRIVKVKIYYGETDLRLRVRSVGAKWDSDNRVWEMKYGDVVALGLEKRIVN